MSYLQRYKKLFEANDPGKGGSFYLQSKVFRSREVLMKELQEPMKQEAETSGEKSDPSDSKADSPK